MNEESKNSGVLGKLFFGDQGLQAGLTVKLDYEVYVYLALAIVVALIVGGVLGGIAKKAIVK